MKKYLLLMSLLLCLAVSCDDSGIDSSIITPDKVEEKVYFAGSIPNLHQGRAQALHALLHLKHRRSESRGGQFCRVPIPLPKAMGTMTLAL